MSIDMNEEGLGLFLFVFPSNRGFLCALLLFTSRNVCISVAMRRDLFVLLASKSVEITILEGRSSSFASRCDIGRARQCRTIRLVLELSSLVEF
jgi:hypothetical protein